MTFEANNKQIKVAHIPSVCRGLCNLPFLEKMMLLPVSNLYTMPFGCKHHQMLWIFSFQNKRTFSNLDLEILKAF